MTELKWTTVQPTVEGLYWVRGEGLPRSVARLVTICGELWCLGIGREDEYAPGLIDEWAGPLEAPP